MYSTLYVQHAFLPPGQDNSVCSNTRFHFILLGTICGFYEKKLLNDLMRHYNYLERPVLNESQSLMLTFGITLQQIIDVVSRQKDILLPPTFMRKNIINL